MDSNEKKLKYFYLSRNLSLFKFSLGKLRFR